MQNAAAERVENMRQFFDEVAQFARRRNDRVALLVQRLQLRVELPLRGRDGVLCLAEQSCERAINRVGRAVAVGMDREAGIQSFRPRSEEHTSELQSLTNLVCRLLLEKKKTNKKTE